MNESAAESNATNSAASYFTIIRFLPSSFKIPLCGKREWSVGDRDVNDPDWLAWKADYMRFYTSQQKGGVGRVVNEAGYKIMSAIDLSGKRCLEIGPGILPHMAYWRGKPERYDIADINPEMLRESSKRLEDAHITYSSLLLDGAPHLPMGENEYDVIISFYSLEHLFRLNAHLKEFDRVLRKGGTFIGAIPAEGGLAWGLGRMLTSRRYARKHFSWDFDKITAWEHCNTAGEVLAALDRRFLRVAQHYWPLRIPLVDTNLIVQFRYEKL
jgi:SAM-dependent methyltransferase